VTEAYHELEVAFAEKIEVSRQRMEEWRKETRELAGLLARLDRRLSQQPPVA
jgi:hypothetical protein